MPEVGAEQLSVSEKRSHGVPCLEKCVNTRHSCLSPKEDKWPSSKNVEPVG